MERRAHRTNAKEGEQFATRRIVIKIGTSTITAGKDRPDLEFMGDIARQAAELFRDGVEIVIVSSGAVASGKREDFQRRDITDKQVEAVYGQPRLMAKWIHVFETHGVEDVGQVLFTDIDLEKKADNAKEVLSRALQRGVVIINYNDAVADEEMQKVERSVDNDKLAGDVARLIDADTLLILTDVDGVLDQGELIPVVDRLEDIEDLINEGGTGTGGAWSKWVEAKNVARDGTRSIIANGRAKDTVLRVAKGQHVGTRFIQGYMLY